MCDLRTEYHSTTCRFLFTPRSGRLVRKTVFNVNISFLIRRRKKMRMELVFFSRRRIILISFDCSPLICRRNHKWQSCLNQTSNRSQWESCLRFSSHCMALNFYRTPCMPGRTCVARHDQCLCRWKFVALSVYRSRSILQWGNHCRYDLSRRHGFLQSDICARHVHASGWNEVGKMNNRDLLFDTVTGRSNNHLPGSMLLFGLCQYLQLVFAILRKWTNLRLQRGRTKNTNIIIGRTVHGRADGIASDSCTRNGTRNLRNSLVIKRRRRKEKTLI